GPDAPDDGAGIGRREIKGLVDVTETKAPVIALRVVGDLRQSGGEIGDIDDGRYRPADDVPLADRERQDRLDVEDVRDIAIRADSEQGVILKRQADHRGDR